MHPLARVDHIHNRLTHSLEVASVGRPLAYAAGRLIVSRGEMPGGRTIEDLNCIVQAARLAHDIGNPPFGHAGEYAIREWMNAEGHLLFGTDIAQCLNGVTREWLHFEGNAQSFRLVSRADNREQSYFRFTYASLGALVKYPWDSSDQRVEKFQKLNVFSTEAEIYKDVVSELGLKRPDHTAARHPLSYLSEAADDKACRLLQADEEPISTLTGEAFKSSGKDRRSENITEKRRALIQLAKSISKPVHRSVKARNKSTAGGK